MIALRLRNPAFLALATALLAAGCGSSRTLPTGSASSTDAAADPAASASAFFDPVLPGKGPASAGLSGLYPLATGNRWHYQRSFTVVVLGPDGENLGNNAYNSEIEHVQTCPVTIAGRNYLTERSQENGGGGVFFLWIRFRQDSRGLYEADQTGPLPACDGVQEGERAPVRDPDAVLNATWARAVAGVTDPARRAAFDRAWERIRARRDAIRAGTNASAAGLRRRFGSIGGPPEGELQRLRYPLMLRQRWVIRDAPRFEAIVEGHETLNLPAGRLDGWRIRYDNEFLQPGDRVYVWYGPQGYLQHRDHLQSVATDNSGNDIGVVISEEQVVLDDFSLVGVVKGGPIAGR